MFNPPTIPKPELAICSTPRIHSGGQSPPPTKPEPPARSKFQNKSLQAIFAPDQARAGNPSQSQNKSLQAIFARDQARATSSFPVPEQIPRIISARDQARINDLFQAPEPTQRKQSLLRPSPSHQPVPNSRTNTANNSPPPTKPKPPLRPKFQNPPSGQSSQKKGLPALGSPPISSCYSLD